MRANFRMQRLFVSHALTAGEAIEADSDQFNYLANVLRMTDGAEILLSTSYVSFAHSSKSLDPTQMSST